MTRRDSNMLITADKFTELKLSLEDIDLYVLSADVKMVG